MLGTALVALLVFVTPQQRAPRPLQELKSGKPLTFDSDPVLECHAKAFDKSCTLLIWMVSGLGSVGSSAAVPVLRGLEIRGNVRSLDTGFQQLRVFRQRHAQIGVAIVAQLVSDLRRCQFGLEVGLG